MSTAAAALAAFTGRPVADAQAVIDAAVRGDTGPALRCGITFTPLQLGSVELVEAAVLAQVPV